MFLKSVESTIIWAINKPMTRHRGLKLELTYLCYEYTLDQQTYDPTQGIETYNFMY